MNSFEKLVVSKFDNCFKNWGSKLWNEYELWDKALDAIASNNAVVLGESLKGLRLSSHLLVLGKNGSLKKNPLMTKLKKILKKDDWEFLAFIDRSKYLNFNYESSSAEVSDSVWYPSTVSLFEILCVVKPKLLNEICSIWVEESFNEKNYRYFEELFVLTDFNGKSYFNKEFKCAWNASWYSSLSKKGLKEIFNEMNSPEFYFDEIFKNIEKDLSEDVIEKNDKGIERLNIRQIIKSQSLAKPYGFNSEKAMIGEELLGVLENVTKFFLKKRVKLYKSLVEVGGRSLVSGADINFQTISGFNLTSQVLLKEECSSQIVKNLSEKDYKKVDFSNNDWINDYSKKVEADFEMFLGLMWGALKDYNYKSANYICIEYMAWVENLKASKDFFKEKKCNLAGFDGYDLLQDSSKLEKSKVIKSDFCLDSFIETLPRNIPIEKTMVLSLSNIKFFKGLNQVLSESQVGQWLSSIDVGESFYMKLRVGESSAQLELLTNVEQERFVLLKKGKNSVGEFDETKKSGEIIGEHFFELKFSDLLVLTCNDFLVSSVKESLSFGVKLGNDFVHFTNVLQKINEMPDKAKSICQFLNQILEDKRMSDKMVSSLQSCLIANELVEYKTTRAVVDGDVKQNLKKINLKNNKGRSSQKQNTDGALVIDRKSLRL